MGNGLSWRLRPPIGALLTIVTRVFFALGFVRASRHIHDRLVGAVFRAPIAFFDTTPTGRLLSFTPLLAATAQFRDSPTARIVNRCGKDLEVVDDQLPGAFDFVSLLPP